MKNVITLITKKILRNLWLARVQKYLGMMSHVTVVEEDPNLVWCNWRVFELKGAC